MAMESSNHEAGKFGNLGSLFCDVVFLRRKRQMRWYRFFGVIIVPFSSNRDKVMQHPHTVPHVLISIHAPNFQYCQCRAIVRLHFRASRWVGVVAGSYSALVGVLPSTATAGAVCPLLHLTDQQDSAPAFSFSPCRVPGLT